MSAFCSSVKGCVVASHCPHHCYTSGSVVLRTVHITAIPMVQESSSLLYYWFSGTWKGKKLQGQRANLRAEVIGWTCRGV